MKVLILIIWLVVSVVCFNAQTVETNISSNPTQPSLPPNIIQLTPYGYISLPVSYWAYMEADFMDAWAGSIETLDATFKITYTDGIIVSIFDNEKSNFKWLNEIKTDDYTITYGLLDNGKIKQIIAKLKTVNFSAQIQNDADIDTFLEIISNYKTGRCDGCLSANNTKQMKRFFEKRFARAKSPFIFTCSNLQPIIESEFKIWLNEEVFYLASKYERETFNKLSSVDDKLKFINNFWLRRDPDPDTEENEYKTEYCERVNYTKKFQSGIHGWKTDRGLVYILFGKPDRVEQIIQDFENLPDTLTEKWFYRYLDKGNMNHEYIFIDPTKTDEFLLRNVTRDNLLKHLNLNHIRDFFYH